MFVRKRQKLMPISAIQIHTDRFYCTYRDSTAPAQLLGGPDPVVRMHTMTSGRVGEDAVDDGRNRYVFVFVRVWGLRNDFSLRSQGKASFAGFRRARSGPRGGLNCIERRESSRMVRYTVILLTWPHPDVWSTVQSSAFRVAQLCVLVVAWTGFYSESLLLWVFSSGQMLGFSQACQLTPNPKSTTHGHGEIHFIGLTASHHNLKACTTTANAPTPLLFHQVSVPHCYTTVLKRAGVDVLQTISLPRAA